MRPHPAYRAQSVSRYGPRLSEILRPEANSFNVVRLLMAALVVVSHSYLYAYGTSAAEPLTLRLGRSLGECAVQVFFILSGIMVAQSFDRSRNLIDFATARALRIFPGLIVCVLATALLLGPLVTSLNLADYFAHRGLLTYIAKTATLMTGSAPLPGVFEDVPYAGYVNSSLWTLKYEVLCYVGLALLGAFGLFHARVRWLSAAALSLLVLTIFLGAPANPEHYGFADNVRYFTVYFGTGVVAYLLREHIVITPYALGPLLLMFGASLGTPLQDVCTALLFGYSALCAATLRFGPLRDFCNRHDASYGVYIYAAPIQQALLVFEPKLAPEALTLLAFAFVLPLALLSWLLVERPALRKRAAVAQALKRWPLSGVLSPSGT